MNNTARQLVAGFDPGGKKKFGWCVAELNESRLLIIKAGTTHRAEWAFKEVATFVSERNATLCAAGIDAPLYWSCSDPSRNADKHVMQCINMRDRSTSSDMPGVLAVNSLQGACISQGPIIAMMLERQYPKCVITETHPGALFYILPEKEQQDAQRAWETWKNNNESDEHQWDAIISAWAAIRTYTDSKESNIYDSDKNLYNRDKDNSIPPYTFLEKTLYWWPKR